jgi:hypothetical protein
MKYTRTKFMTPANNQGTPEVDLVTNDISRYIFRYPTTTYRVVSTDVQRPDRIASKLYGSQEYWWLLMKYNSIDDVWNELYGGLLLTVPDIRDLDEYISKYRK